MRPIPDVASMVSNREIISTDEIMRRILPQATTTYFKRDFLFKPGHWRGQRINPLLFQPRKYLGKKLVIGHSDIPTSLRIVRMMRRMGVTGVYGVNVYPDEGNSYPIPLGITNDCDDSPAHRILGNVRHFLRANQDHEPLQAFDGTIYINFTWHNNPSIRKPIIDKFSRHPRVKVLEPEMTDSGRIRYLSDLRQHSLVLCPIGNGIDTHRLWETLYMGGTPVVSRHPITDSLVRDLPVIQVDDWDETLNYEIMEQRWNELRDSDFNLELLKVSEWIRRISDI